MDTYITLRYKGYRFVQLETWSYFWTKTVPLFLWDRVTF